MPKPRRLRPPYKAMIVAPQPEATESGLDILQAGGNALDAVIACALTQGVVDPMMCGVGGLGSLHLFDPQSGQNLVFDGLSTCPSACRAEMWTELFERECSDGYGYVLKGGVNELGHASVTTPGIMRVFGEAHAAFGKLPFAELFGPAIGHAEHGWVVRPHVATMFALDEAAYGRQPMLKKLAFTQDGRALYLRPDGTPKRVGDSVRNPDLGATLRSLAREGAESFYTGELARRIVEDMRRHGGPMTLEDLANFKVQRRAPLKVGYRGRVVATPPPPGGGIMVAEMLRILEGFELSSLEHNGPEYIRVLAEAMKIAGRDKERHIGDPDFVPPPLDRLLSDAYAQDCASGIRRGEKTQLTRLSSDCKNTTTVSCIDRNGLVVSLTHTNG
ncbi:MAG: gamma-glutamyltransferase family protein, partial [Hyphomicrobiales bacterium]